MVFDRGAMTSLRATREGEAVEATRLLVLLTAAIGLAGCNVVDSTRISQPDMINSGAACNSELGFYALPRAYIRVRVGKNSDGTGKLELVTTDGNPPVVTTTLHPDPAFVYCLSYRSSPFADDSIDVVKAPSPVAAANVAPSPAAGVTATTAAPTVTAATSLPMSPPKTPFLGAVTVNATDQTAYILEALIRAATLAISGRTLTQSSSEILVDLEYDPFNPGGSAEVNRRLRELGFCLVLDGYTYSAPVSPETYCSDPFKYAGTHSAYADAYARYEDPAGRTPQPGIFYKPRLPYELSVYHKVDPRGPTSRWRLENMVSVSLENISPVLSLGVDRSYFAGRRTYFSFTNGALATACLAKGSEILGFADVPLAIAKSIVQVPSQIVMLRINQDSNENNLVMAQNTLLAFQQQQLALLSNPRAKSSSTPAVPSAGAYTAPGDINVAQIAGAPTEAKGVDTTGIGGDMSYVTGDCMQPQK
jgi:hypothetical protein